MKSKWQPFCWISLTFSAQNVKILFLFTECIKRKKIIRKCYWSRVRWVEWRGEEKTPGCFKKVLFAFILSLAFIFSSRAENMPNTCVVYGCNIQPISKEVSGSIKFHSEVIQSRLCSCSTLWPLAYSFCSWTTRRT